MNMTNALIRLQMWCIKRFIKTCHLYCFWICSCCNFLWCWILHCKECFARVDVLV